MIRCSGGKTILALLMLVMMSACATRPERPPMPPRPQLVIVEIEGGACMPTDSWTRLGEYILMLEAR